MASKQFKPITVEEVAKHNQDGDLWVIIDAKVYDLSRFSAIHPGGKAVLLADDVRGQDATDLFYGLHKSEVLLRPQYVRLQIGVVPGQEEQFVPLPHGSLSPIPYGEPQWLSKGFSSPYYGDSHRRVQKVVRTLMDEVLRSEAQDVESSGQRLSQKVFDIGGELQLHAARLGPGKHLKGLTLVGGAVTPEEFDYFHELIIHQELARSGYRTFQDAYWVGAVIGLPPVLNFGRPEIQHIVPDILAGKKFISLAISEAFAGSDVAGIRSTAKLSDDKKFWIVNGSKKWITNGHFSDYFSTGVRTDKGLTMLLIPRGPGVETKLIKTAYSTAAGTAYITFDNVKVPVENTLGEVNQGLKVILSNFNHERWAIVVNAVQGQRNIVDASLRWASQRKAFGKPLIELAIVRAKLAQMISRVESSQTWLEHITYQMNHMTYPQQSQYLAGPIALLKQYISGVGQDTARDVTQIFGGRAITQSGLGSAIELFHRTIAYDAILGGSEDVLADLGVRQAQKFIPKNARL